MRCANEQITERVAAAVGVLDHASLDYRASGTWALFSGGDDSLATAIVTSQAIGFRGCLHIDTGIGIPETQEFVIETCRQQGWPLQIYRAVDQGQSYDDLVIERGFPGPAMHFKMYCRLKERALNAFIRDHKTKWNDRIILSTGIRKNESQRRMGRTEQISRDKCKVWVNAIYDWSKPDCHDLITAAGIPGNPVVELMHMSGECLCGSFAKPGELQEIALWYPRTAARIEALAERVKAAGHDGVWGQRPKPRKKRQPARLDSAGRRVGPLCQQCELHFEGVA